jgi:hypothetical protein
VIEQITYLLFVKRLDDLHTLEERKSTRLNRPMERRVFPAGADPKGRPYEDLRWSRLKNFEAKEMYTVVAEHVFSIPPYPRRRRLHLCASHEGCAIHDPDAGAMIT